MGNGWIFKLTKPIKEFVANLNRRWNKSLVHLERWMETELIDAMVDGGYGIQGIAQTDFYRYITSPEGLSELGIETSDPPRLLEAYRRTLKVSRKRNIVSVKFGNYAELKMATPHPFAGVKNLHVTSWLEFVVEGVTASSGFVPRARLPQKARKYIRLNTAPGGLMLPAGKLGSTGQWKFPAEHRNYQEKWLRDNLGNINRAVQEASARFLNKKG